MFNIFDPKGTYPIDNTPPDRDLSEQPGYKYALDAAHTAKISIYNGSRKSLIKKSK